MTKKVVLDDVSVFIQENSVVLDMLDKGKNGCYVFMGKEGLNKTEFAKAIIAKCLGVGKITVCPDYYEISSNEGSIGIEQILSLNNFNSLVPVNGDRKFCLICEADKLTVAASNALLKTIEEAVSTVYIFIASEPLLDTVMSRSRLVRFFPADSESFKENIGEKSWNQSVAQVADGRIGLYKRILEDKKLCSTIEKIVEAVEKMSDSRILLDTFGQMKEKDSQSFFLYDKYIVTATLEYLRKQFCEQLCMETGNLYEVYGYDGCCSCVNSISRFLGDMKKLNVNKNEFMSLVFTLVTQGRK